MKNVKKHVVRAIALSLVGTALAFAHPTDPGVGGSTHPSEMRQEKLAFVQFRVARAATELASAQALALACDRLAAQKAAHDASFLTFDERGVIEGLEAIWDVVERSGIPVGRLVQVDVLDPSACL